MRWVSDQYTLASLQVYRFLNFYTFTSFAGFSIFTSLQVLQVSQFLPFLLRLQLPGLSSLARRQDMDKGQGWVGEEKILKDLCNRFQKICVTDFKRICMRDFKRICVKGSF